MSLASPPTNTFPGLSASAAGICDTESINKQQTIHIVILITQILIYSKHSIDIQTHQK